MLNLTSPLLKYRKEFSQYGYVSIPNFFENSFASHLQTYLHQIPPSEWYNEIKTSDISLNTSYYIDSTNEELRLQSYKAALNDYRNGVFSYSVKRTHFHRKDLYNKSSHLSIFNTQEFKSLLGFITGYDIVTMDWCEINKGTENDFVNEYTPANTTSISVSYNLTQNWLPNYGGVFQLISNEGEVVFTDYNQFNSILILDSNRTRGMKRHLSTISIGETVSQRLCIDTGYTDLNLLRSKSNVSHEEN